MRPSRSARNLAKMLAYMLGRRPDEFGLIPDAEGFVKTKDLLKALREEDGWGFVNEFHVREAQLTVPGPPFEIDGHRIRSRQPQSATDPPSPEKPPKLLYAHIRRRAQAFVHANGIHPSSHPQVVLSADRDLAERLGRRIDPEPVILTVHVQSAEEQGVAFSPFGQGLFLADHIPAGCFSGPPLPKDLPEEAGNKPAEEAFRRPAMPGSFRMDPARVAAPSVPGSPKRTAEKGRSLDRGRRKKGRWQREKPPWKK
jgi:putative RNA 2'-phosphotransferase